MDRGGCDAGARTPPLVKRIFTRDVESSIAHGDGAAVGGTIYRSRADMRNPDRHQDTIAHN